MNFKTFYRHGMLAVLSGLCLLLPFSSVQGGYAMSIFKRNTTLSVIALALFICLSSLAFSSASDASPQPSNEVHFCGVVDYEAMRARDSIYAATKRALNLNVGEPRTVRMIYFLPNDRPFRQEVVDEMKVTIRQVQTFFADQMAAHGYADMTFRYETDAQGDPLVHRVDGQHPDSHYLDRPSQSAIWDEIALAFDIKANIYFIVIDNSINAIGTRTKGQVAGVGGRTAKNGGFGLVAGGFGWNVVAHELGHGFGLQHDFRDGEYLMSYGQQARLSACHAEFLTVHPYFNPDIPIEETPPPTPEHINATGDIARSVQLYPAGSTSVSIQIKVSDSEGLHQVLLFAETREPHLASGGDELIACRGLAGETNAVVAFDYDGVIPSGGSTSLSDFAVHGMRYVAGDMHGNYTILGKFFLTEVSANYLATLEGHTLEEHTGVASIAFSPNGAMLATGGDYDFEGKVWDVKTKKIVATFDTAYEDFSTKATYVAFSPDGATLAYGAWETYLWDIATQTPIATLEPYVVPIAFSHDGAMLASSSTGGDADGWHVVLWDVKTRQKIATLPGHETFAGSIAFSPDDRILAATSEKTIKLWDVKTKQPIATLEGHKAWVESIAFSPDGTMLASGSHDHVDEDDETVKVWDVKTKQVIATFAPRWGTGAVAFSPDGAILVSAIDGMSIALWDVKTKQPITLLGGHTNGVKEIAFSPDGTTLASGDSDGNVLLWDMSQYVTPVAIIPDANLRAAIRDALGKSAFAPITVTDMARLTTLDASNRNIRELDGLESATQLTDLNLKGNPLSSSAVGTDIPALQERGVAVVFDDKPTATPDFSGDGAVDIADFLLFVEQFGLSQGDAGYDARFDLDEDGAIGIGDFLIFVNAFGTSGA